MAGILAGLCHPTVLAMCAAGLNMGDIPNYADVPADYPYRPMHGTVAGYQPKLLLTSSADGRFYSPGNAPHERWHDWNYSITLASAMAQKCLESKSGKRAHMKEAEIILQYYLRAVQSNGRYGTEEQLKWTFTQVAKDLGWPLPEACRLAVGRGAD
jgi:hypothetical protein